jgi:hypothetical protein
MTALASLLQEGKHVLVIRHSGILRAPEDRQRYQYREESDRRSCHVSLLV